jgi:FixJ family two-component response regulator
MLHPAPVPIVFVVDDDISVRQSLDRLIRESGWRPKAFASAEAFLAVPRVRSPSCLVLELGLPGFNGLDLQGRLTDRTELPIIFITRFADVPMTVQAMKAGAVEILTKPISAEALVGAIRYALDLSQTTLINEADMRSLLNRYRSLTARERQVMGWVVSGLLNKQIGDELGIKESTVKAHRGNMMRKMIAGSVAELVRMAARLGLAAPPRTLRSRRRDAVWRLEGAAPQSFDFVNSRP